MSRKVQIVLGTTSMEVTPEPIASNTPELYAKGNIVGVFATRRQVKPNNYSLKYTTPSGAFTLGETITGGTSARTAVLTAVTQHTFPEEWQYDKPVMTIICVILQNDIKFDIELQDVTNQATWNTGTLAAQQQAIADINAWL